MKICVASNNKNKIRQFGEMFSSLGAEVTLFTAKELGFTEYPPEDADTFAGNSLIKAKAVYDFLKTRENGYVVLADDSGLCVDVLGGEPGVKSARYASTDDVTDASDDDNNKKLMGKLEALCLKNPDTDLSAKYVAHIVAILPDGQVLDAEGTVSGRMVFEPRGNDGFGYDPYFFVDCYNKTFAELTPDERNAISHRGKAVRKICEQIVNMRGAL